MRLSRLRYSPVKQDFELELDASYTSTRAPLSPWLYRFVMLSTIIVAAFGGFIVGRQSDDGLRYGLLAPAGDKLHKFVYDRTFATAPTEETASAWGHLFPQNGGFIHHRNLASNYSCIAVFHQLHCLQSLYYLYYNATGEYSGGDGHRYHLNLSGSHDAAPPAHARHCFDYLRQALMCHADTNLEQYDYTLDGVTGWGQKQCRDYGAVMEFAEEWGRSKWA